MAKAKGSRAREKKEQSFLQNNAITRYLRETRAEMAKVTWPERDEALRLTGVVLAVTVAMAAFLGVVDAFFAALFRLVVGT